MERFLVEDHRDVRVSESRPVGQLNDNLVTIVSDAFDAVARKFDLVVQEEFKRRLREGIKVRRLELFVIDYDGFSICNQADPGLACIVEPKLARALEKKSTAGLFRPLADCNTKPGSAGVLKLRPTANNRTLPHCCEFGLAFADGCIATRSCPALQARAGPKGCGQ